MLPILPIGLAALTLAAGGSSGRSPCPGADRMPAAGMAAAAAATRCLVNRERADAGVRPLVAEAHLRRAAATESADLVARQYFSHVTPDGRGLLQRIVPTGYLRGGGAWLIGEDLGWGTGDLATPRGIVRAWMASPPHREAMLDGRFHDMGVGIALGNPRSRAVRGATYALELGSVGRRARSHGRARTTTGRAPVHRLRDPTPIARDVAAVAAPRTAP